MPRLWSETLESHRKEVQQAILETTARLVQRDGLRAVTMSQIAEEVRIGRATLYKYYPDVETILRAWHEREIAGHLEALSGIAAGNASAVERLRAVLSAFASITRSSRGHDPELGTFLHTDSNLSAAETSLYELVHGLIAEARAAGDLRTDATPGELMTFCLHALGAAGGLQTAAAVDRLVDIVMDGILKHSE